MKKNLIGFVVLFLSLCSILIMDAKAEEIPPLSEKVKLYTTERTWQGHSIVLMLENLTDEEVVISGDIIANIAGWQTLDREMDHFAYEEGQTLTIPAFDTVELVRVSSGNPMTWRNFYHGQVELNLILEVDGDTEITNSVTTTIIYEEHEFVDEPLDLFYFSGDTFEFTLVDLPRDIDEQGYINSVGDKFTSGKIYIGIMGEGELEEIEVFEGMEQDEKGYYFDINPVAGEVTVTGIVKEGLPFGFLGYTIELYDDDEDDFIFKNTKPFGAIDWIPGSEESGEETVFVWVLPSTLSGLDDIEIPNFNQLGNLYETVEEFELTAAGVGSVTFGAGLHLIQNIEQLELLATAVNIGFDGEKKVLKAKVDTSTLSFLAGKEATIKFYNAMSSLGLEGVTADNFLDYLSFSVKDGETLVEDISEYLDITKVVYDPDTDILTIPVNHFTEYVISLSEENFVPNPKTGVTGNSLWLLITTLFVGAYFIKTRIKHIC